MKKGIAFILIVISALSLVGCKKEASAEKILDEFLLMYGGEGTVYSSDKSITDEGYITEDVLSKAYVYEGDFPKNFAILLNSRTAKGFECGVFICEGEDERATVLEMCRERLDLLSERAEEGIFVRSGNLVFYTTASDKKRAEEIIKKIIRSYY